MIRVVSSERRMPRNPLAWDLRHNSVKVLEDVPNRGPRISRDMSSLGSFAPRRTSQNRALGEGGWWAAKTKEGW